MKVIIFGVGEFAKQLDYYLSLEGKYEVDYFCVNKQFRVEATYLGKDVITLEDGLEKISTKEYKFILGVGYKNMRMRKKIFEMLKDKGFDFINYISPYATVHGEIKGEGNVILSNVVVEPFSIIKDNNIIWSNTVICHDSVIDSHNFIAANSVVGGFSEVRENNFLGFNTIVKDNVVVDKEVLIGANSLVIQSPENYSKYYGTPAKKISEHYERGIEI